MSGFSNRVTISKGSWQVFPLFLTSLGRMCVNWYYFFLFVRTDLWVHRSLEFSFVNYELDYEFGIFPRYRTIKLCVFFLSFGSWDFSRNLSISPKSVFLNQSDIWAGWLCVVGGCPVHSRMFSCILELYSLDARSKPPVVTNKSIFQHFLPNVLYWLRTIESGPLCSIFSIDNF